MPVLKAKIGGTWVDLLAGPDEVYVGPSEPADPNVELWYDSDDPGSAMSTVQSGTYTPTLTNVVVGTGGSARNEGRYTFVGGPSVGDAGVLSIAGAWALGTTGQSFTGIPYISLPAGFAVQYVSGLGIGAPLGLAYVMRGSATTSLVTIDATDGAVAITPQWAWNTAGTYLAGAQVSTTIPLTWVAGDGMRWAATMRVVRV